MTFEGEASTALMYEAERYAQKNGAPACILPAEITSQNGYLTMQTTALAAEIARRYLADRSPENKAFLAYQFHAALAELFCKAAMKMREDTNISTCALSGGVFQNRLLTALCRDKLTAAGFTVLLHGLIPPNDGGICIGQAVYGMYYEGGTQ